MHRDPDADASARLMTFDTLGSTSAEALSRARAGEQGPLWIVAERQTPGRGRRGNARTSAPRAAAPPPPRGLAPIRRAHAWTPVTRSYRMPSFSFKKKNNVNDRLQLRH